MLRSLWEAAVPTSGKEKEQQRHMSHSWTTSPMLPTTIILGAASIPVTYLELDDLYGLSTEYPKAIEISSEVDSQTQAQTLLHEVLHHVSWMYGLEWSERRVKLLEAVLVDLVQENPGLFRELLTNPHQSSGQAPLETIQGSQI